MAKYLTNGTEERVCSGSQDEDIFHTSRKEWQQELEATGHIVSIVKKQRVENGLSAHFFFFTYSRIHGMDYLYLG